MSAGRPAMRAVVVGGSIAGLSAARVLRRSGIETLVLEESDGAMHDRGAGLGLDPSLVAAVFGHDADPELPQLTLRGRALHGGCDGARAPVLDRGEHRVTTWQHLHAALRQGLGVPVRTGAQVCGVRRGGGHWEVLTRQGEAHRADLVIGADGHRSAVRRHVDPSAQPRYCGYLLWRGMVAADALDDEVRAAFLDGYLHLRPAPGHHFVSYEVPAAAANGPRRLNWGWYAAASPAARNALLQRAGMQQDIMIVPPARLAAEDRDAAVERAAATWPRPWARLVAQTAAAGGLFVNAIHEFVADAVAREPVVLLGDAAHLLSPITGSGAALAMRDALALEAVLAEATVHQRPAGPSLWAGTGALAAGQAVAHAARRHARAWAQSALAARPA
jgi:2-polyprenyl-6-methoxyphenol hydroxylase-like FAD-dependent oxidoreductase